VRKREETNSETEEERARCSIGNKLRHSITRLPKSINYLLREEVRERHRRGVKKRDRRIASEMLHLQQSKLFHYTPAAFHHLPCHGGREIESETEGERARCSICNKVGHSQTES